LQEFIAEYLRITFSSFTFALRYKIITAQIYEIGNRIGNKLKGESRDLIKFKT